jgi:hypothetical protein
MADEAKTDEHELFIIEQSPPSEGFDVAYVAVWVPLDQIRTTSLDHNKNYIRAYLAAYRRKS